MMKLRVNVTGLESSKNFEKKLQKTIADAFKIQKEQPPQQVYLSEVAFAKKGGYGQYAKIVQIELDGVEFRLSQHSTDSETYDRINNLDYGSNSLSNILKNIALDVIADKIDQNEIETVVQNRESEEDQDFILNY